MGRINWSRVLILGSVAGMLWSGVSLVLLYVVGRELLETMSLPRFRGRGLLPGMVLNIVVGSWAMWLYAAIRPRYGPGPRTAAIAGFAWWVIAAALNMHWSVLLALPYRVTMPLVAAWLPALIAISVLCAQPYREADQALRPGSGGECSAPPS